MSLWDTDPSFWLGLFSLHVEAALSIGLPLWSIRRRGELDYSLDERARKLRYTVIGLGFVLSGIKGEQFALLRVISFTISNAFIVWPNWAYHANKLLPGAPEEPEDRTKTARPLGLG